MHIKTVLFTTSFAITSFSELSEAYWRINCGVIQTSRIDPIVSPGKVSRHVHKFAGAANIGPSSTYEDLQQAECTSCEVQADKSAYWTPQLYYQHSNGQFEEVENNGMLINYLNRADIAGNIKPFPEGFRMASGDALARSYDTSATTYRGAGRIADRVKFACLDPVQKPEGAGMNDTQCTNGLRAFIHFQSCWNGRDLYKEDNSHVAYLSGIDYGVCPPGYPVQFMHLSYEVLYSLDSVKQDGGQFVFANGDPTGYGFHGDFFNGWSSDVQKAAIEQCTELGPSGALQLCAPLWASTIHDYPQKCPTRAPLTSDPVTGLIDKLPGCLKVSQGPERASEADMLCENEVGKRSAEKEISRENKSFSSRRLKPSKSFSSSFSTKSISPTKISIHHPLPTNATNTTHPTIPFFPITLPYYRSYVTNGCFADSPTGQPALNDTSYTDPLGMTPQSCILFCEKLGKGIAGLRNGKECLCGAQIVTGAVRVGEEKCKVPCVGNGTLACGGRSAVGTYLSG